MSHNLGQDHDQQAKAHRPRTWWEKLADINEDRKIGRRIGQLVLGLALVGIVAYLGITLTRKSRETARGAVGDVLSRAQELLPQDPSAASLVNVREAGNYYSSKSRDLFMRQLSAGAFMDAKGAAEYVGKCDKSLADLREIEADASASKDAWLYWNTVQQLHWYAAMNSTEPATRKEHLQKQIAVLDRMKKDFANHMVLSTAQPSAEGAQGSLVDRWRAMAEQELKSVDLIVGAPPADAGLSATFELEGGKSFTLKFYSSAAPKTVETFVALIQKGFFNGSAFHGVDSGEGTLTGGSALSRIVPERARIWHKDTLGYAIPNEANPLLRIVKGSVTTERAGSGSHGSHFVIHTEESATPNYGETVFAEVSSGLEHLEAYLKTAVVVTDPDVDNKHLPVTPLRIVKATVTGTPAHASDDSWRAVIEDPKTPELSAEEKRLAESQPTTAPTTIPTSAPAPK
jgi:cyclophilin family peptidyl-prolyl cis-trans isomerase